MINICDTARQVDEQLAGIARRLKMLFFLNPVNSDAERERFWSSKSAYEPRFRYKPLDFDRDLVRRELYELRVEHIADPVMQDLYRKKRWEIDNQLSLLDERGTDNFSFTSEKLFGSLDEQDVRDAHTILEMDPIPEQRTLSAQRVKRMLEGVVASYERKAAHPFECKVRLRKFLSSNAAAGERSVALKSHNRYSINDARILGVHEVGWHVLTANNGARQPLHLFAIGLPGFLGTQEGTAIFAEYMSGTLTVNRLRIVAGRTLAVSLALQGWKFSETYDYLMRMPHGFDRTDAFTICERAYRGGKPDKKTGRWRGVYTKDAIYQRYFVRVVTYWRAGLDLNVLSAGKMALDHVPMVAAAIEAGVLRAPIFLPAFVSDENNLKLRRVVMGLLTQRPDPDRKAVATGGRRRAKRAAEGADEPTAITEEAVAAARVKGSRGAGGVAGANDGRLVALERGGRAGTGSAGARVDDAGTVDDSALGGAGAVDEPAARESASAAESAMAATDGGDAAAGLADVARIDGSREAGAASEKAEPGPASSVEGAARRKEPAKRGGRESARMLRSPRKQIFRPQEEPEE